MTQKKYTKGFKIGILNHQPRFFLSSNVSPWRAALSKSSSPHFHQTVAIDLSAR